MASPRDLDSRLLRALRSPGLGASAAAIEAEFALGGAALDARIAALLALGYRIENEGGWYRLLAEPLTLIADDLCASLPASAIIGREILVFAETDSTNDLAARAGRDGAPGGLVIFAETQRAGRGRLGRRWVAPSHQALLCSVLIRPISVPLERWQELTFCAALAVAETAEAATGLPATIKWPNDVLINDRKVAGILLELHRTPEPGFVVVGIGLNVRQQQTDFPPELRHRAGSLAMYSTQELSRRAVAAGLLMRLESHLALWESGGANVLAACLERGCRVPPRSDDAAPPS